MSTAAVKIPSSLLQGILGLPSVSDLRLDREFSGDSRSCRVSFTVRADIVSMPTGRNCGLQLTSVSGHIETRHVVEQKEPKEQVVQYTVCYNVVDALLQQLLTEAFQHWGAI